MNEVTDAGAVPPADESPEEAPPAVADPLHHHRHHRHHRRTPVHTRRARTTAVALAALGVAVAVPFLGLKAARTIANSRAGRTATTGEPAAGRLPDTPAALLVEVGPGQKVAGLTLLALGPSGSGGAAVIVPAGTETVTAGPNRPARIADAYDTGGLDAEEEALEGVLGITTTIAEEVDEAGLTRLLAPYAPLRVVLDDRVLDTDATGHEQVLYPAGPVDLTAAEAAHLLVARGPNESEIARLPRTAAVWSAVLAAGQRSGSTPSTTAAASAPTTFAAQLAAVAAGAPAVRPLQVRPVLDAVANPDGVDLLAPDNAGQKLLMAEVLPGAISPANSNIRFRIVNASGHPDLLYAAVGRLAFVGANVVIVSEQSGPSKETLIEYQDPDRRAEAARYLPVVGPATVRQSADRIDGIDATIVLGQDFATFMRSEDAKVASSTTTGATTSTTTPQRKP